MMKNNPFFLIGTLGILMTAMVNILLHTIIPEAEIISYFSLLYPVSIVFLLFGAGTMVKKDAPSEQF